MWKVKVIALVYLLSIPLGAKDIQCRGGDGPTPFSHINLPASVEPLPTVGEVREFIHWPGKDALVYRNSSNHLRKLSYKKGKDVYVAKMNLSLSRLVDPEEKFILTDRSNYYMNVDVAPAWGQFSSNGPITHLFWHRAFIWGPKLLFSISNSLKRFSDTHQELEVLKFTAWKVKPSVCQLHPAEGEVFYLGQGHRFPYVFLYKILETVGGSYMTLYRVFIDIDDDSCRLELVKKYPNPIPGEIQSVHQFEEERTFGVVTRLASTNKLFWDSPKMPNLLCDFGERMPLILNEKQPLVFGWERETGLSMVAPDDRVVAQIPMSVTEGEVGRRDLWLNNKGNLLFIHSNPNTGQRKLHPYRLNY